MKVLILVFLAGIIAVIAFSQDQPPALSSSWPPEIQRWDAEIIAAAKKTGLDVNLIAAVMMIESGGDPDIVNPRSGAVGLLQVMPRESVGYICPSGRPCFENRPSTNELLNPQFNVSYGAELLAGLVQQYGDIRPALWAYYGPNGGWAYANTVISVMNKYK